MSKQKIVDVISQVQKPKCAEEYSVLYNGLVEPEKIIIYVPSIQNNIVRCRDCKHRYVLGENVRYNACELNHNYAQSDDWYCADAERIGFNE